MIPTPQRSKRLPWGVAVALLATTLLTSAPSLAEPTAAEKETARALLGSGQKKFDAGDYAGALEAWRAADDIMHVPSTGLRVGKAQEKLGKLVEARDAWLEVTRHIAPNEPRVFTAARKEAAALAAAVEKRIPSVTVTVNGVPQGVELDVSVDGVSVPPAAALLPRKVNPGPHRMSISAVGYLTREEDFTLTEGESRTLNLELQKDPAAAVAPQAPAAPPPEPPPPIQPRDQDYSRPIDPKRDEAGGSSTLTIVGFTLAGVGVVVGGITGIMSATKTSDIKDDCDGNRCPGDSSSDIDSAKTLATVSNIGFGVGILGLGLGIVGLITNDSSSARVPPRALRHAKRGVTLTPVVGLGSLNVVGRF